MRLQLMFLSMAVLLTVSGCSLNVQETAKSDSVTYNEAVQVKDIGKEIWDQFLKRNGESFENIMQVPQEPDLMPLYIEGLKHESPVVRWYAANKAIDYAFDEGKEELSLELEKLKQDKDERVRKAAEFALSAIERSFEGERFFRTKDGKKAAFYRFYDLPYNEGELWIYTETSSDVWYKYNVGGSITHMNWSPDGNKLSVEYGGRSWHFVSLIDTTDYSLQEVGLFSHITKNQEELGYKLKTNPRADPQVTLLEWSPEGDKMLLFYSFTDDDYTYQSGTAVYDTVSKDFPRIMTNPPSLDEGISPKKPQDFKW